MNAFFPIYFRTRFQLLKNRIGARVTDNRVRLSGPVQFGFDNLVYTYNLSFSKLMLGTRLAKVMFLIFFSLLILACPTRFALN